MLAIIMAIENEEDRSYVLDIYNKYEKQIYAYAYSMISDEEYSRDCVHDVIGIVIEELESFKEYDDKRKIKFMMACCRNSVYNKYSYKQRLYQPIYFYSQEDDKEFEVEFLSEEIDICEEYINKETRAKVHKYIRTLDMQTQNILSFRFECGLPTKRIAKHLGLTDDVVRQRIVRAEKKIKKLGGKELHDLFKS